MNISMNNSLNGSNSYLYASKRSLGMQTAGNPWNDQQSGNAVRERALEKSLEVKKMVRSLNQTKTENENPYAVNSKDKIKDLMGTTGSSKSDKDKKAKKHTNYNYKEVANKILRAKTSVSAGQAVLSAKRKVLEVRRKMAGSDGDADELQAALTHAKRMEMAARKKKHHLELEELVVTTQQRDEKLDKMEEAASDINSSMVQASEEQVTEREDAIFEEREEMLSEITEGMEDSGAEISDDRMAELNEMIAEFGEEELKQLEEEMEMLENMEVIDPHMSKEDLEDLKRKHRSAENKAIMKANMDYLKTMIKHSLQVGGAGASGGAGSGNSVAGGGIPAISAGVDVAVSGVDCSAAASVPSIDVQL
ncbi:MAG: hypothetical protein IJ716_05500 [Lachnospiraceae bacterium]|nr:hypothetical protein [Lachnospiraceae bacterium]